MAMDGDTLLLRQVNPAFVQNGVVSSQAFRPTPKDDDLLSVYDGDMMSAQDSFDHFSQNPLCRSVGVVAVSVAECASLDLTARPDPAPFPEHAVIDFSTVGSKGAIERKARELRAMSAQRGWLYKS